MDAQANNVLRHLKKQVIESETMYLASVVTWFLGRVFCLIPKVRQSVLRISLW